MSKFLKLKSVNGYRVLVAASEIAAVFESGNGNGSTISLANTGEEIGVKEGYQTVVNRLTKGDADEGDVPAAPVA